MAAKTVELDLGSAPAASGAHVTGMAENTDPAIYPDRWLPTLRGLAAGIAKTCEHRRRHGFCGRSLGTTVSPRLQARDTGPLETTPYQPTV